MAYVCIMHSCLFVSVYVSRCLCMCLSLSFFVSSCICLFVRWYVHVLVTSCSCLYWWLQLAAIECMLTLVVVWLSESFFRLSVCLRASELKKVRANLAIVFLYVSACPLTDCANACLPHCYKYWCMARHSPLPPSPAPPSLCLPPLSSASAGDLIQQRVAVAWQLQVVTRQTPISRRRDGVLCVSRRTVRDIKQRECGGCEGPQVEGWVDRWLRMLSGKWMQRGMATAGIRMDRS